MFNKKFYFLLAGIVVFVAVITATILSNVFRGGEENEDSTPKISIDTLSTEEENALTKQVLEKYVDATIEGYQKVENDQGLNDVVVINIKNISDEKTNLALDVVALDDDGNVLDKTSLYAEGIEPGQTQIFQAFALSELAPEQLQAAHYEIYRAKTYKTEAQ